MLRNKQRLFKKKKKGHVKQNVLVSEKIQRVQRTEKNEIEE